MDYEPRLATLPRPEDEDDETKRRKRFLEGWRRKQELDLTKAAQPVEALVEKPPTFTDGIQQERPTVETVLATEESPDFTWLQRTREQTAAVEPTSLGLLQRLGQGVLGFARRVETDVAALPASNQEALEPETAQLHNAVVELDTDLETLEGVIELGAQSAAAAPTVENAVIEPSEAANIPEQLTSHADEQRPANPRVIDGEVTSSWVEEIASNEAPTPAVEKTPPTVEKTGLDMVDIASFALMALMGGGIFTAIVDRGDKLTWQSMRRERQVKREQKRLRKEAEQSATEVEQRQAVIEAQAVELDRLQRQELASQRLRQQKEYVSEVGDLAHKQAEITHQAASHVHERPEAVPTTFRIPEYQPSAAEVPVIAVAPEVMNAPAAVRPEQAVETPVAAHLEQPSDRLDDQDRIEQAAFERPGLESPVEKTEPHERPETRQEAAPSLISGTSVADRPRLSPITPTPQTFNQPKVRAMAYGVLLAGALLIMGLLLIFGS